MYCGKERGRREILAGTWQMRASVYTLEVQMCGYLEGKEKIIILNYIFKLQIPVYVSTYLRIYAPLLFLFLRLVVWFDFLGFLYFK